MEKPEASGLSIRCSLNLDSQKSARNKLCGTSPNNHAKERLFDVKDILSPTPSPDTLPEIQLIENEIQISH
jgi:hypothetical protein